MRTAILASFLVLAGCGEAIEDDHFERTVETNRVEPLPVRPTAEPVRVGELGGNFPACTVTGATRNIAEGARLEVRSAPFELADTTATIAPGTRFHICARSLDQAWSGIVWDQEDGTLSGRCEVSTPVPRAQAYDGPCRSGWVPNAYVQLRAG